MALRHHSGCADEGQVPSEAEQHQRDPEMRHGDAGDPDHGGRGNQCEADARDALDAKRAIKAPVTKLGAYIASTCHWMPSAASVTE